jgi:N-acetylglucosaminyldiphosphoundecaprenol N-acetyl-beta-D-mannosaminyltransferase
MRDAMAAGTMPEISRRFFDAGYRAQAVASETTDNTSPGSISKPPQPFLPIRFSTYYRQWDPAATQSWNTSLTEERADTDQSDWIEQPSVSPR